MTSRECQCKFFEWLNAYKAEVEAGQTLLNWEAWRVTKGYIVTEKKNK